MDAIDFRSDTVTWPTPPMREAMMEARVGDDVYGEDPTIDELEAMAAELTGKEAGLFVASGTMGNLVGILAQATRGEQVLLGIDAHCFRSEAGSLSALGGVVPRPMPTDSTGRMRVAELEQAISPDDPHYPRNRLVALENSYGAKQGMPLAADYFAGIRLFADKHGLSIHLDGARLFNAAVALGVRASDITRHVDSVSFCLSKGLCAPVGSVVCGSTAFIKEARRIRKALGGGMRQAGILAAAGIVALNEMTDRLVEDHENARRLALGLAAIPGIDLNPEEIRTNIVFFELSEDVPWTAAEIARELREKERLLISVTSERGFRAVTHYWVGPDEVAILLGQLQLALAG
ncbi:MAG: DegT/DnrJ/EryC1/StrS family aminotransferase [Chloroflexota bacterium]|nr:MAG: DegT/DnrJ/EryC1/StrS family aminotransferase [Chloroflexota bacterium]